MENIGRRRVISLARDIGGARYPIGAIPLDRHDWIEQCGELLPGFVRLKRRSDQTAFSLRDPESPHRYLVKGVQS
jgi:hypothetical protein